MLLVQYSDWEALYDDDGNLLMQNHSIDSYQLMKLIGGDVITANKDQEKYTMDHGSAPTTWIGN